ncbi:protein of unknown function [Kytococcus aerolatus]|uniref:DUF4192 domain-containing protein n=1 Tax=Kytococcus aerolatus TaxID=592308 RepID=A0A212T598_9MICO|nr:DUF4192 family protein [Kytococcus aerolatus]SNC61001.1 protein of unknown function [Kytococcus aerolatus]
MTTTTRVRDVPDLLAVVPLLLGFEPARAAVLLSPTPSGHVALQRVPLPDDPLALGEDPLEAAVGLLGAVRAGLPEPPAGPTSLVVYLDDPGDLLVVGPVLEQVADRLWAAGREVVGPVVVCEGVWWVPECSCDDPFCGEPAPVPLPHESAAATALVAAGAVVHGSVEAMLAPWSVRDERPAGEELLAGAEAAWTSGRPAEELWPEAFAAVGRMLVEGDWAPDDGELARVLHVLADVQARDAVIAFVRPQDLPASLLDERVWAVASEVLTEAVDGHETPSTAESWRAHPLTSNLRAALARTPWSMSAPLACLAAVWAWGHGDGLVARHLCERALRADPAHRLAGLVLQLVHHGIRMDGTRPGHDPDTDPARHGAESGGRA